MRYLTLGEVLELHRRVMAQTGGAVAVRDLGALESAVAQPRMTVGGRDAYTTRESKAAALAFSLIQNHPFLDGSKRVGHAAMETFLVLNGVELKASSDESEATMLSVAAGQTPRDALAQWIKGQLTNLRT